MDKEEQREYQRQWRLNHPNYHKKWYWNHRLEVRLKQRSKAALEKNILFNGVKKIIDTFTEG